MGNDLIKWLASYPKSGNTWVRLFLNAYCSNGLDVNESRHSIGDVNPYYYQTVSPKPVTDLSPTEFNILRPAALAHMLTAYSHIDPLFIKTHNANVLIDDIALIPPSITDKAVYIVRDPRDVCISYANHFNVSIDDAIAAMNDTHRVIGDNNLIHTLSTWSNHINSWLSEERFKVGLIRYEDICANPRGKFIDLLTYLGIEVDIDRFNMALDRTSFNKLSEEEDEYGFKEAPNGVKFFKRGGTYWQETLTQEQAALIVEHHGTSMQRVGYATAL